MTLDRYSHVTPSLQREAAESIAAAIERIVSDTALRDRLRLAGVRHVSRFSWERAAQRHRAAFERAMTLGSSIGWPS